MNESCRTNEQDMSHIPALHMRCWSGAIIHWYHYLLKDQENDKPIGTNLGFFFLWECKFFYAFLLIFTSLIYQCLTFIVCAVLSFVGTVQT